MADWWEAFSSLAMALSRTTTKRNPCRFTATAPLVACHKMLARSSVGDRMGPVTSDGSRRGETFEESDGAVGHVVRPVPRSDAVTIGCFRVCRGS